VKQVRITADIIEWLFVAGSGQPPTIAGPRVIHKGLPHGGRERGYGPMRTKADKGRGFKLRGGRLLGHSSERVFCIGPRVTCDARKLVSLLSNFEPYLKKTHRSKSKALRPPSAEAVF